MSLNFYITAIKTSVYSGNYTHNVIPMWELAGIYDDLYNSEGKKCKDIITNLKKGLDIMLRNPDKFRKLNPPNGWGDYDSAVKFLKEIINNCEKYPDGEIEISK